MTGIYDEKMEPNAQLLLNGLDFAGPVGTINMGIFYLSKILNFKIIKRVTRC